MVAVVVFSFLLVLPGSQLLTVGFPHRSHAEAAGRGGGRDGRARV